VKNGETGRRRYNGHDLDRGPARMPHRKASTEENYRNDGD
jgi:hypothetical protein